LASQSSQRFLTLTSGNVPYRNIISDTLDKYVSWTNCRVNTHTSG